MRLALRELRRRPAKYAAATAILSLLALLLMFLGGLLDGLIGSATQAVSAQRGELIVFSAQSRQSFPSSRITGDTRAKVTEAGGGARVGGIGVAQFGARLPDAGPRDLVSVALFGYEIAPRGVPESLPDDGEVYADSLLRQDGVREGMTLLVGPARSPVVVVGFVDDVSYLGQATLWGNPATWRAVQNANRPDDVVADSVFQALIVKLAGSTPDAAADLQSLAAAIDAATGSTATLTVAQSVDALPGVKEQRATFGQIIGVTLVIAIVVVGLFFALITVERLGLYGVLKAIGARSRTLFAGLAAQAVTLTFIASAIAAGLGLALDAALAAGTLPFELSARRIGTSVMSLLLAAILGSAFSLRRVLRVDPASAIGQSI